MSIDMSQFYQVFYDECAEHLASMESLLLALDPDAPDAEQLNAVFRAAHSIKGGAGTFGFTEIASTTHSLESLLDRLRKGELALCPEMIDAFLRAKDVISDQLALRRGETAAEPDPAAAEAVMQWLDRLAVDSAPATALAGPASGSAPVARETPSRQGSDLSTASPDAPTRYEITLQAGTLDGASLELLFDTLREVGQLEILGQPAPRKTRRSKAARAPWRLALTTTADEVSLRDLIAFVIPVDDLDISRSAQSMVVPRTGTAAECAAGVSAADTDPGRGRRDGAEVVADPGFGFFDDVPNAPMQDGAGEASAGSDAEAAGYGFFAGGPGVPSSDSATPSEDPATAPDPDAALSPGRRASDQPEDAPVRAGRRATDKQVVATGDTASIRVGVEKVDVLMNLVSELVITQSMLMASANTLDPVVHERLLCGVSLLERNTRDLQEAVMSIRMLPIGFVFSRFPRVVRDLASQLGKKVDLKTRGESAELDKGLIEKIADPLTHLVRNSLDHGIETPDVRVRAGKPETGTIILTAMHQGGNILIEVSDDGAGLDRTRILAKARERGMAVSDSMSDAEVWQLIFEPGFSTAQSITNVSGRGVGMDVVRRNIAEMNGAVTIESMAGIGTRMTIRLPLTMAILDGLSVKVGDSTLIIPLNSIVESLQPGADQVRTISGRARTVAVRGEYLNVIELRKVFGSAGAPRETPPVMVIVESGGHKAALCVDELLGQHQVVIKSLETNYRKVGGVSGATIMGDGQVALIVDVPGVVRASTDLPAAA
ncbi:MAG: chemotaxis protein CheW [Proteobacteria bacterium]|nr:chemotaxis protein CheW [Burkholderiales bacterium]